jgi:hypothetical protein
MMDRGRTCAASGGSSSRAGDSTFDAAAKRAGAAAATQNNRLVRLAPLEDSAFSDEFCRFLQTSISSVDAAEVLLALAAEPQRAWLPNELAQNLRPGTMLGEADVARYLEQFEAAGLVVAAHDGRREYRPANPLLRDHVVMLAQAYKERPVTLFRVIYALRDLKIQSFADAFKLKRK